MDAFFRGGASASGHWSGKRKIRFNQEAPEPAYRLVSVWISDAIA